MMTTKDEMSRAGPGTVTKKTSSELIGFMRKSNSGAALKLSLSVEAFEQAKRYSSQDGQEYVGLVMSLDKAKEVMEGEREVTSVCQLVEG